MPRRRGKHLAFAVVVGSLALSSQVHWFAGWPAIAWIAMGAAMFVWPLAALGDLHRVSRGGGTGGYERG